MLRVQLTFASCLLLTSFVLGPAAAVEPDAPETIISKEEALRIALRTRISRLPRARQQGEQDDRNGLAAYYASRDGRLLWVNNRRPTRQARLLLEEIARADEWGLRLRDFDVPSLATMGRGAPLRNKDLVDFELETSLVLLKYARHARGGRLELEKFAPDIDRRPPLLRRQDVLENAVDAADPAHYLHSLHPRHQQFQRLLAAYNRLRKKRSKRHSKLAKRLQYNIEMWRWMPRDLGDQFVWANIPEYKVRVVSDQAVVHQERIIVGKRSNKTPVFSDAMETVVFQPYWNLPNSIKIKELLPSLLGGGSVLRRQNLRVALGDRVINPRSVDWSRADIRNYRVYQPPGRGNALGRVKFLFPNRHAVYMHDTPTKHLFKRRQRAFSHGCMRVRNPLKLAEVVLNMDRGWTRQKINSLVRRGPENNEVALDRKIPVHVTYFTANISGSGEIKLFKDLYGHEKRIEKAFKGRYPPPKKSESEDLNDARRRIIAGTSPRRNGRRFSDQTSAYQQFALGAPPPRVERRRVRTRRQYRPSRRLSWDPWANAD